MLPKGYASEQVSFHMAILLLSVCHKDTFFLIQRMLLQTNDNLGDTAASLYDENHSRGAFYQQSSDGC